MNILKKTCKSLIVLAYLSAGLVNANVFLNDGLSHSQPYLDSPSVTQLRATPWDYRLSQSSQGSLRSQSDVIREVKSRYNAEVLKISLSSNGRNYRVRILKQDGTITIVKVRAIR